jgi:ferritin-like metal-binding protein YciE
MELKSLDDVLEAELKDLYSAEKQLVEALPDIADAASSKDLKEAVNEHLEETRGHVKRLEQVFEAIGVAPESEHCDGMEGLISEGSEVAEATGDGDARDAALIGAAQRVEHYEIAAYGTMVELSKAMGETEVAELLGGILAEEKEQDEKLTEVTRTTLLPTALGAAQSEEEDGEGEEEGAQGGSARSKGAASKKRSSAQ